MTSRWTSGALAVALGALIAAGCDVAGTAVRTTGEAAGETTKAASDVAKTAGHTAGEAVEQTTKKAGEAIE